MYSERVLPVDPSLVWALVADPSRAGEWAAVETVGYMGTELPKPGQALFVKRRWRGESRAHRVEIEDWEAGTSYRCKVATPLLAEPLVFSLEVKSEVTGSGIGTRIRIDERMELPRSAAALIRWYEQRAIERRLDRIARHAAA